MAASDVEVVADAIRTIRVGCTDGTNPAALVAPARLIAKQTLRYPTQVFESGDADRALEMHELANDLSMSLATCDAPAAAAVLKKAYAQT